MKRADQPALSNRSRDLVGTTSFVGRERYLRLLRKELQRCRLVALVGSPGVGKTRLATVFSEIARAEYPGGVHFVDAATVDDPDHLLGALAAALPTADGGSIETVARALGEAPSLIVLDRCEAFEDATRAMLAKLLDTVDRLRVVATSRVAPILDGSPIVMLPPLSLPEDVERSTAAWTAGAEAVQLFVDRARIADATFELTDANCEVVARLCRRLDGIPGAIEAAAGWVRAIAVTEILDRIERDPAFVTRRRSSGDPANELASAAGNCLLVVGLRSANYGCDCRYSTARLASTPRKPCAPTRVCPGRDPGAAPMRARGAEELHETQRSGPPGPLRKPSGTERQEKEESNGSR